MKPNFKGRCLVCETKLDLTSDLVVNTYDVSLCREHEDISMKRVNELILKRVHEIDDMVKKMESYGMVYSEEKSGLTLPVARKQVIQENVEENIEENIEEPVSNNSVLKIERRGVNAMPKVQSFGGTVKGVNIAAHNSIDIGSVMNDVIGKGVKSGNVDKGTKIPVSNVLESKVVRGRAGANMVIPSIVETKGIGRTVYNVVGTSDQDLQKRFKGLNEGGPNDGYSSSKECSLCGGTGITKINGKDCIKCGGAGIQT